LNDGSVVLIAFGVRGSGTGVSSQDNEDKGNDRNLWGFGRRFGRRLSSMHFSRKRSHWLYYR
jgi:hypothetical protein